MISNEDNVKRVNNLLFTEEHQAVRDMLPYLTLPNRKSFKSDYLCLAKNPILKTFHSSKDQLERVFYTISLSGIEGTIIIQRSSLFFKKVNKKDECQFAERWWQERNLLARDLLERKNI